MHSRHESCGASEVINDPIRLFSKKGDMILSVVMLRADLRFVTAVAAEDESRTRRTSKALAFGWAKSSFAIVLSVISTSSRHTSSKLVILSNAQNRFRARLYQ